MENRPPSHLRSAIKPNPEPISIRKKTLQHHRSSTQIAGKENSLPVQER